MRTKNARPIDDDESAWHTDSGDTGRRGTESDDTTATAATTTAGVSCAVRAEAGVHLNFDQRRDVLGSLPMTFRLTLGIDPGLSGAIAVVADGEPTEFFDMPTMPRPKTGNEINSALLAACIRGLQQKHLGAYMIAILENVHAMPGQGVSSTFRFGESFGCVKGVLGALSVPYKLVEPTVWKRKFGLLGKEKDYARTYVITTFPQMAIRLARKKDCGRADALLMARWAHDTEQVAA